MTKTKVFDGKKYELFDFAFSKREANQEAKAQRKQGFFARIVPAGEGYHVWLRKSYKGER